MTSKRKIALFSLYDQENVVLYAQHLINLEWDLVATKETEQILTGKGIPVKNISEFLGIEDRYPFPPTLHPKMELALTTEQDESIALVYDTTYPLAKGNDVGGHTLLALAAKGMRIVVSDKKDMEQVIDTLKTNNNEIDSALRQQLIDKANAKISRHYYSLIEYTKDMDAFKILPLLEGENPYQVPAYLMQTNINDSLGLAYFEQVSGNLPCFTNLADFDCILQTLCSLSQAFKSYYKKTPYIVIAAKHGNPCGLAVDWHEPPLAIKNALFGNPRAIWGGEVITNFPITAVLAKALFSSSEREQLFGSPSWMLDVIGASDFDKEAVEILGKRPERKLFKNESLATSYLNKEGSARRMVRGGFLRQPLPDYILDLQACAFDFIFPDGLYVDSLLIAWATAWFSNHGGNEVAVAKDRMLIGVGGGPATIDACDTALMRAHACGHEVQGSVFAADAFFPHTDAPEQLIKAGCVYGLVPDGGKNAALIKQNFKKSNVNVFYLPEQFRGFCRH